MRTRTRKRSAGRSLARGGAAGWTPAALPSLALWLTAGPAWCFSDAGTTPCGDGDPVRQWTDRGGLGHAMAQATAGMRPTLRLVSGRWYVRFDGADDYVTADVGTVAQPFTAAMAFRGYAGGTGAANLYRGSAAQAVGYRNGGGATYTVYAGSVIDFPAAYAADAARIDVCNGAGSLIRSNAAEYAGDAGALGLVGPGDTLNVGAGTGGGSAAALDLADFVVTTDAMSAADRALYAAYTQAGWGVGA